MNNVSKQYQKECYISLIDTHGEVGQKTILALIDALIKKSKSSAMAIQENQQYPHQYPVIEVAPLLIPLEKAEQIVQIEKNSSWPNWHSKTCLIVGSLKKTVGQVDLCFLDDIQTKHGVEQYDVFCQQILSHYDWAFFSNFTTYSANRLSFITQIAYLHDFINQFPNIDIAERYDSPSMGVSQFRHAIFSDYCGEWLLPVWLAKEQGEALPLLLCMVNSDKTLYEIYSHQKEDYIEDSSRFAKYTDKLVLIDQWQACPYEGYEQPLCEFQLYAITDLDAYNALWSHVSHDGCIAQCVLAADCNIALLKKYTEDMYEHGYLCELIKHQQLASWAYHNFYGGGADEHCGWFYAADGRVTNRFWQALGHHQQAALQAQLHMAIFYNENKHWQLPLLLHDSYKPPILLTQIYQEYDYHRWCISYGEYIDNTVWYEDALSRLALLERFELGNRIYQLHAMTDEAAYHELCHSDQVGHSIVFAVLDSDCDIAALKQILDEEQCHNLERMNQVASWIFSHYIDRSSVYFYSKDRRYCQQLYELLNESDFNPQISRF